MNKQLYCKQPSPFFCSFLFCILFFMFFGFIAARGWRRPVWKRWWCGQGSRSWGLWSSIPAFAMIYPTALLVLGHCVFLVKYCSCFLLCCYCFSSSSMLTVDWAMFLLRGVSSSLEYWCWRDGL